MEKIKNIQYPFMKETQQMSGWGNFLVLIKGMRKENLELTAYLIAKE